MNGKAADVAKSSNVNVIVQQLDEWDCGIACVLSLCRKYERSSEEITLAASLKQNDRVNSTLLQQALNEIHTSGARIDDEKVVLEDTNANLSDCIDLSGPLTDDLRDFFLRRTLFRYCQQSIWTIDLFAFLISTGFNCIFLSNSLEISTGHYTNPFYSANKAEFKNDCLRIPKLFQHFCKPLFQSTVIATKTTSGPDRSEIDDVETTDPHFAFLSSLNGNLIHKHKLSITDIERIVRDFHYSILLLIDNRKFQCDVCFQHSSLEYFRRNSYPTFLGHFIILLEDITNNSQRFFRVMNPSAISPRCQEHGCEIDLNTLKECITPETDYDAIVIKCNCK